MSEYSWRPPQGALRKAEIPELSRTLRHSCNGWHLTAAVSRVICARRIWKGWSELQWFSLGDLTEFMWIVGPLLPTCAPLSCVHLIFSFCPSSPRQHAGPATLFLSYSFSAWISTVDQLRLILHWYFLVQQNLAPILETCFSFCCLSVVFISFRHCMHLFLRRGNNSVCFVSSFHTFVMIAGLWHELV